jgi:hypothetical protein
MFLRARAADSRSAAKRSGGMGNLLRLALILSRWSGGIT